MGVRVIRLSGQAIGDAIVMALQGAVTVCNPPLPVDTKVEEVLTDLRHSALELVLSSEQWTESGDGSRLNIQASLQAERGKDTLPIYNVSVRAAEQL